MLLNQMAVVLFGASLLYISTTSRLGAYVNVLSLQGVLLFLVALTHWEGFGLYHTAFLAFETLVVKAVLIPAFISRIIKSIGIVRVTEPFLDNFLSLIVATLLVSLSFVLAVAIKEKGGVAIDVLNVGISLAAVMVGLFIMMSRKKLITHVMGYLVLENGVFLLSLSLVADVPVVVEMGVLLDIFIGIFLMGIFLNRIKSTFDSADVSELTSLTD